MLTQQNMHAGVTSFLAKTHATTSAKFVNSGVLVCDTPSAAAGQILASVANNGQDFVMVTDSAFEYREESHLHAVLPSTGPTNGGTSVEVIGTNVDQEQMSCRF